MLECGGCGNKKAHRTRTLCHQGGLIEGCDLCMGLSTAGTALPDTFLGGGGGLQTDENIVDKQGREVPFSSKREKAAIMKELGLKQADSSERNHGARPETTKRRTYFT